MSSDMLASSKSGAADWTLMISTHNDDDIVYVGALIPSRL